MKFMRSHMIIWGRFFSVGLVAPHPLRFYLPHLFFWIEPIQLLLASLSSLDDVFAEESDVLSGMAETISHSPLFYLDLLPFSYITLLLYILILLLMYSNIVV